MQNRAQLIAQAQGRIPHPLARRPRGHPADRRPRARRRARARVLDHRAEAEQSSRGCASAATRPAARGRRSGRRAQSSAVRRNGSPGDTSTRRAGSSGSARRARASRRAPAFRSAGALALLTATAATEASWLIGGQVYERFALKATQLGIAHQPINAPIETESLRRGSAAPLRRHRRGAADARAPRARRPARGDPAPRRRAGRELPQQLIAPFRRGRARTSPGPGRCTCRCAGGRRPRAGGRPRTGSARGSAPARRSRRGWWR